MSISEAQPVKITSSTPQDISDELLGGTISFCQETGYKPNIMVITFLWSGFLLSSKSQLDEYGLVENVLSCYTHSLGSLFPQLREDSNLKEQVIEILQHYWDNIKKDFNDMNNSEEVSEFLQIANKLNSQDDASSTYLLNKAPNQPFKKTAFALHSSIDGILYQIDNGLTIQYRGIVQHPNLNQNSNSTKSTTHGRYNTSTNSAGVSQHKNDSNPWIRIGVALLIIVVFVSIVLLAISNDRTPAKPSNQEPELIEVQEPMSGEILIGQEDLYGSEITITASGGSSCVVKLKTSSGTTRLSFYVRAGDTVTVGVPAEYLYVYFASGDTWYGEDYLFGSKTRYSMDDEITDFTQGTWEYTLTPVANGNFSETPIDPEDF